MRINKRIEQTKNRSRRFQLLRTLSEEELLSILNVDKLKHLSNSRSFRHKPALPIQLKQLAARLAAYVAEGSYKRVASYAAMLREAPGYPALMLWCAISLAPLDTLPLLSFTFILSILAYIAVSKIKEATYLNVEHDEKKLLSAIQLKELQIASANELQVRYGIPVTDNEKGIKPIKPHKKARIIQDALELACITSATLYTSFYMAYEAVFVALQFEMVTAFMTSITGIATGLIVAMGVGIYCGYKQYENDMNKRDLEKKLENLTDEFERKEKQCKIISSKKPNPSARGLDTGQSKRKGINDFLVPQKDYCNGCGDSKHTSPLRPHHSQL